jgi:formate hydrogenlyase subunit 6/NADH:ubiquinone oxidoreductase subunit I
MREETIQCGGCGKICPNLDFLLNHAKNKAKGYYDPKITGFKSDTRCMDWIDRKLRQQEVFV